MKSKSLAGLLRITVSLMLLLVVFTACTSKTTSSGTITASSTVSPFAGYGNISANVFGLANFEGYSQTFSYPVQYSMPPISISWMGNIFNGLLNGAGSGADTTYLVHGSISEDGAWVESMIYTMQVKVNSGLASFFRVTLQNVPLTKTADAQGNPISVCTKNSTDVQRFVTKIEYLNTGGFTYVGTDLGDSSCVATLSVTMAAGPGIGPSDGSPVGLAGQGMM